MKGLPYPDHPRPPANNPAEVLPMRVPGSLSLAVPIAAIAITLAACGGSVPHGSQQFDSAARAASSDGFSDADAPELWQKIAADPGFRRWLDQWNSQHAGKPPTIMIGPIRNNTQEPLDHLEFTRTLEREITRSGKVLIAPADADRADLRDDQLLGRQPNTPASRQMLKQGGADLVLTGEISDIRMISSTGHGIVGHYQLDLKLRDLDFNDDAWIGSISMKKTSTLH